ncbi:MAG: ribonuclease P protein component [Chitinophagaceae bacterium]|nr:MAG: ribonuclease P protein component [Chitinophagaceae bacterium]
MAARFTLGKNERLKSRKLITQLFNEGKSISSYPFRIIYSITPEAGPLKAGFTVSSKNFKKAVDRNKVKRLLREAYRLNKSQLIRDDAGINLFIIYTAKEILDFKTIHDKLIVALEKIRGK